MFGLVRCLGIVMLVANEINENKPNATLVAATVPKDTWAFLLLEPFLEVVRFEDSSLSRRSRKQGD